MSITDPFDVLNVTLFCFEVFGIDRQVATNFAIAPIFKRGHPVLAVNHDLAHLPHLSLM